MVWGVFIWGGYKMAHKRNKKEYGLAPNRTVCLHGYLDTTYYMMTQVKTFRNQSLCMAYVSLKLCRHIQEFTIISHGLAPNQTDICG
jgi:hypothetical protein